MTKVIYPMHQAGESSLPDYCIMEEKLQRMIYERFGLGDISSEEEIQIKEVDDALLYYEFEELMGCRVFDNPPEKVMEHDFAQKDIAKVEKEFLSIFKRITNSL